MLTPCECKNCGKIENVEAETIEALLLKLADEGWHCQDASLHQLTCPKCYSAIKEIKAQAAKNLLSQYEYFRNLGKN